MLRFTGIDEGTQTFGVGYKEMYQWLWISGQGAFLELEETIKTFKCPIDKRTDGPVGATEFAEELRAQRCFWDQIWPIIEVGVFNRLNDSFSRAILLSHFQDAPWNSLWIVHRQYTGFAEPMACDLGQGVAVDHPDVKTPLAMDLRYMNARKLKFWDPKFGEQMQLRATQITDKWNKVMRSTQLHTGLTLPSI